MNNKKKIEINNFYDNFGELKGWDHHVEEFQQSQNLLKVLQRKIALPKVQKKE